MGRGSAWMTFPSFASYRLIGGWFIKYSVLRTLSIFHPHPDPGSRLLHITEFAHREPVAFHYRDHPAFTMPILCRDAKNDDGRALTHICQPEIPNRPRISKSSCMRLAAPVLGNVEEWVQPEFGSHDTTFVLGHVISALDLCSTRVCFND